VNRALLVAVLSAAIASVAAIGVLVARGSDDERPAAVVPSQRGPFRGGSLPAGLDRSPAYDFRLRDARGGVLDTRALRGRPYVLTFLYTDCRDVCPLIGREIGEALRLLGPRRNDVAALAVSADPAGDSRQAVRAWLRRHRLPRNFHYLIGSRARLAPVWRAYFAAPQPPGAAESRHTASIWLVDKRGRLRTKFSGGAPVAPRDLVHDLRLLLAGR
jgi:protein SCO1/2